MKIRYGKGRCMWTKCAGKVGTKLEWLHFWDFKLTLTTKKCLNNTKNPATVKRSPDQSKLGNLEILKHTPFQLQTLELFILNCFCNAYWFSAWNPQCEVTLKSN